MEIALEVLAGGATGGVSGMEISPASRSYFKRGRSRRLDLRLFQKDLSGDLAGSSGWRFVGKNYLDFGAPGWPVTKIHSADMLDVGVCV
jgi:hypothetical protein